jgi:hypothetical protein
MGIEHETTCVLRFKYPPFEKSDYEDVIDVDEFLNKAISNINALIQLHDRYKIIEYSLIGGEKFIRTGYITFPFKKLEKQMLAQEHTGEYDVKIELERKEGSPEIVDRVAKNMLILYLHDLFLIFNLSLPGGFDLGPVEIEGVSSLDHPLLSAYSFFWCSNDKKIKLFPVEFIPINIVHNWYRTLIISADELPKTDSEKALYTLLRLSYLDQSHFKPETSTLVTYAIEALFGGSIPLSLLKKRVAQHFKMKNEKPIKKILDNIFKWRNMFVHGEMPLPHPLVSDVDDIFTKKLQMPYFKVIEQGYQIILSTLQSLIKNNANGLNFVENISFKKIDKPQKS